MSIIGTSFSRDRKKGGGQIITAIDLRNRLGLTDAAADAESMNVVVGSADGPVSFLVDDVGDVLDAEDANFELPPETLSRAARTLIRGAYNLPDRILLALDFDELLNLPPATTH